MVVFKRGSWGCWGVLRGTLGDLRGSEGVIGNLGWWTFCTQLFDFINLFYGSLDEKMKKFQVYKVILCQKAPSSPLSSKEDRNERRWWLKKRIPGTHYARRAGDGVRNANSQRFQFHPFLPYPKTIHIFSFMLNLFHFSPLCVFINVSLNCPLLPTAQETSMFPRLP